MEKQKVKSGSLEQPDGWSFSPGNAGHFGTDYLTRSATAWKYIYVFSAEEAIYPTADVDSLGNQLNGPTARPLQLGSSGL